MERVAAGGIEHVRTRVALNRRTVIRSVEYLQR
jgi:hypothetical protein